MNSSTSTPKKPLSAAQAHILLEKGTEPAFSGELLHNSDTGRYMCAQCGQVLFTSESKYDSGSGWPSFWQAVSDQAVSLVPDDSHGMNRTEVRCAQCGGHLGHLFEDGPAETTGMRYCINSLALDFKKE